MMIFLSIVALAASACLARCDTAPLPRYERELKRLRAELEERSRSVVDQRRLLELDEQRRRAEADKMAAIRALEARSLEFMREKEEKRRLEERIASLTSQVIRGETGVQSAGDGGVGVSGGAAGLPGAVNGSGGGSGGGGSGGGGAGGSSGDDGLGGGMVAEASERLRHEYGDIRICALLFFLKH